jgi:hypothetical protein
VDRAQSAITHSIEPSRAHALASGAGVGQHRPAGIIHFRPAAERHRGIMSTITVIALS